MLACLEDQRLVVPPEVEDPVDPLVPLLLLVPAVPPDEGVVAVELPDAPIPEVAPDDEVPVLGAVDADEEPVGEETEPVAEPPVDPMPDAVPDALPDAVVPQAASAAVQITERRILIKSCSCSKARQTSRSTGCRRPPMGVVHMPPASG